LIELLVVIAILALLLSLLTPSLQQAREIAKMAKCASQMHGLGLATAQYTNDQGGMLPWNRPRIDAYYGYIANLEEYLGLPHKAWHWDTIRNIKQPYPLWCPKATGLNNCRHDYYACEGGTGYGANFETLNYIHRDGLPTRSPKRFPCGQPNLNRVAHPSRTMMYMETARGKAFASYFRPEGWLNGMGRIRFRHFDRNKMNVLYFDGHVEPETYHYVYYEASQQDDNPDTWNWSPSHAFWYVRYKPGLW